MKKSTKVDYSGAIFTFEGIVRGKEENMDLENIIIIQNKIDLIKEEIAEEHY